MKTAKAELDTRCMSKEQHRQALTYLIAKLVAQLTNEELFNIFNIETRDTDKEGIKEIIVSLK